MHDRLSEALAETDTTQLAAFQRILVAQSARSYTWTHGDAAELVCGYLGDDGYTDFRSWVIAQGRTTYEAFVADPDSLAGIDNVKDACGGSGETFGAAAAEVYEEKGGTLGDDEVFPILELTAAPRGKKLSVSEIRAALPRLSARFSK